MFFYERFNKLVTNLFNIGAIIVFRIQSPDRITKDPGIPSEIF